MFAPGMPCGIEAMAIDALGMAVGMAIAGTILWLTGSSTQ